MRGTRAFRSSAFMPTRGATTVRCFESTRPVKKTTTKTAARPKPTTLKTCFMAVLHESNEHCQAMSEPALACRAALDPRKDTVYIHSMPNTPPKGQRAISRDEAPRPEEA